MFWLIFELIIYIIYMFNGYAGFILSLILFLAIFLKRNRSFLDKIFTSLIISMPLFNVGFLGRNMHHMFSWINLFLLLLMFYCLFIKENKYDKKYLFIILNLIFIVFINCFFEKNFLGAIIEWIQIIIMIVPIYMVSIRKDKLYQRLEASDYYINLINYTLCATALVTIIQAVLYYQFGIKVGEWTFFEGRTKIDFLFKGSSVLSMFLGMSIPLNIKKFYDNYNLKYIFVLIICFIGIIVNSARTGIVSGLLSSIPIFWEKLKKSKKAVFITLILFPFIFAVGAYSVDYMLESRHSTSLIEENGRVSTYSDGINQIFSSPKNFFWGSGLSSDNYNFIMPHNLFLETFMTMGFVCLILILFLIIKMFKLINLHEYKYLIWSIFIGSMFITNFAGNVFATVLIALFILQNRKMVVLHE